LSYIIVDGIAGIVLDAAVVSDLDPGSVEITYPITTFFTYAAVVANLDIIGVITTLFAYAAVVADLGIIIDFIA
jgi:hypothetical protein